MSNYEARQCAYALIAGGWTCNDKDLFVAENAKLDDPLSDDSIDMIFKEMKDLEV